MAGGAGGHEAERLAVKVVPDTGGFAEKLKKFLKKQEEKSKVDVKVEADTTKAKAELDKLQNDLKVNLNVEVDAAGVREQLARLARDLTVNLATEVDTRLAAAKLARLTRDQTVVLRVKLDATLAKAELLLLARDRHTTVHINTDHNEIDRLSESLGAIGDALGTMGSQATGAFNSLSRVGNSAGSAMSNASGSAMSLGTIAMPLLAAAIIVAIGAIAGLIVAVGALVGALALVVAPVALIALGVMFATVGQKGYGAAKKLSAAYKDVSKTLKSVMNTAVKPMADEIAKQTPKLNKWINTLQGPLKKAFDSASKYVPGLGRALGDFVDNALIGLNTALSSPGMKVAMTGFNSLIGSIGKGIGSFFIQLSKYDFGSTLTALGDGFAKLMPSLADMLGAFASVSPGIIDSLVSNLEILFAALENPAVLDALSQFASFSFAAITIAIIGLIGVILLAVNTWNALSAAASATWNFLKTGWSNFMTLLSDLWSKMKAAATGAFNAVKNAVVSASNATVNGAINAWNRFTGWLSSLWSKLTSISSSGSGRVKMVSIGGFQGIASAASSIIGGIVGIFQSVWNTIAGIVSNIIGAVGRAKAAVSSVGGLLSKVNPFDMVGPKLPPPPDGKGVYTASLSPMGGLIADLGRMARQTNDLGQIAGDSGSDSFASSAASVLSKIYQITINAAPTVPTEKSLIKALDYADAVYAP